MKNRSELEDLEKSHSSTVIKVKKLEKNNKETNEELENLKTDSSSNLIKVKNLDEKSKRIEQEMESLERTMKIYSNKIGVLETESGKAKKELRSVELTQETDSWKLSGAIEDNEQNYQEMKKSISTLRAENLKLTHDFEKYVKESEARFRNLEIKLRGLGTLQIQRTPLPSIHSPIHASSTTKPIRGCDRNPCHSHASCQNLGESAFSCRCKTGFTGDGIFCTEMKLCDLRPCHSQASCRNIDENNYQCTCNFGYNGNGKTCTKIRPCDWNPCHSEASCRNLNENNYQCTCNFGYNGNGRICTKSIPATRQPPQVVRQLICDFDARNDLCSFTNSNQNRFNWVQHQGSTPTPNTGPTNGVFKNGGNGGYLYIETSGRRKGENAVLVSPRLSPGTYCARFYTHMFGSGIGSLNVRAKETSGNGTPVEKIVWSRIGQNGNFWRQEKFSFRTKPTTIYVQLLFTGIVGSNRFSNIALDEIIILPRSCN